MVSRSGYPWGGFRSLLALACAHALRGAWHDADAVLELLLDPGRVFHDPGPVVRVVVATFRQLVRAYAEGGHALLDVQVSEVMQHMRTDSYSLAPLCALVELADLMATPSLAEPPAEALRLAVERGLLLSSGWIFLLPRVLGVAATLGQRWDQAEGYFHAAIAAAQCSGTQPELGRTYMDYGRMLTARGGPGDQRCATELLTRARAVFDALEMRPFTQRVQPLIQPCDAPAEVEGALQPGRASA
jgi:hypothetical protein